MKKLLLALLILTAFTAGAQDSVKVLSGFFSNGMPGHKDSIWQLNVVSPLYKLDAHTIGVNAAFIGVDSIPTFKYAQTNQTKVVKMGLMDSVTSSGIQFSPSLLYQGVDSVFGGLKKKVGIETYVEPILNTSTVWPSLRMRWFFDTTVNSGTGVGTGYSAMDLYHNASKTVNGISTNLDFPNGSVITGFSNYGPGNVYGISMNNGSVSFPMGASVPLTISNSSVAIPNGSVLAFNALAYLHYLSGNTIGVGVSSLDFNSGGLAAQLISLGAAPTIGAGKQFAVYGSQGTYGSVNSAFQSANAPHNNASISYTSGSANMTGSGGFLSMLNVGDSITYNIGLAGGTLKGKIASITDDTHLTLGPMLQQLPVEHIHGIITLFTSNRFLMFCIMASVAVGTATPDIFSGIRYYQHNKRFITSAHD
jgi:hypothetical protein